MPYEINDRILFHCSQQDYTLYVVLYKAVENVFSSYIARYKHKKVMGGFKTVTQNKTKLRVCIGSTKFFPTPSSALYTFLSELEKIVEDFTCYAKKKYPSMDCGKA